MATKDKDYRLVTLITDVCLLPCRKLFEDYAQSDPSPGVPYSTLDNYMTFRKHDVQKLMKLPPKSIRKDQFDLIYPVVKIEKWDVTLLSSLLFGLFRSKMAKGEDNLITIIREIRNKLQHKPGSDVLEDTEFDTIWNDVETATLTLALLVGGSVYEDEIRNRIADVKINNLPRLGDTLKLWYEDIIIQLRNDIEELKETSKKTADIIEATTKRKVAADGKTIYKRLRTDDALPKNLKAEFEKTLDRELSGDFDPPQDHVSKICSKLRDDHFVVVSGYENTSYLATALSAITDSEYDIGRCIEMRTLDDWIHIDPEETDLVLFCEPVQGTVATMGQKEKKIMTDTFRSMVESASMSDVESRIDVVIVSDHKAIVDWKEQDDNRMFEDIVVLYKPTEETNPLDLVKRHSSSTRRGTDDVLGNMLAYSEAYIQQWRTTVTDQVLFESAKKKFKDHKAIVITGPKGSGKTNFAVNLVSSCYENNQCVVLTETSEWKHVILGEVSVIIIDELAGKFKYNAAFAEGWLSKFDLIYAAVNQGKINVIITCEASRFSKVMKMTSGHVLLNHRIRLTDRGLEKIVVKKEPVSPFPEEQSNSDTDTHDGQKMTNDPKPSKIAVPEQIRLGTFEAGPIQTIGTDAVIKDFCEMPEGTIVVLCGNEYKHYIAKLDTDNYTTIQSVELPCEPNNTSFIGGQEVVIFMKSKNQMQHAIVGAANIELKEMKSIPVNHAWFKIVRTKDDKYIMCTETSVFIYNLNWEKDMKLVIKEIIHCLKV